MNDDGAICTVGTYTPTSSTDTTPAGLHGLVLIPASLAVDANRDGTIVMANDANNPANAGLPIDMTSQSNPYRFWVNNDDDSGTDFFGGSDVLASDTTTAVPNPDWQSNTIVSLRDLEDWTRLWIYTKGLNTAINSGAIKVGLKWKNITRGTPGIKIVHATDSDGGLEYLGSSNSAELQISEAGSGGGKILQDANDSHTNIVPSSGAADFVFPTSSWTNLTDSAPKTFFLFEGTGEGEGELEIVFLKSDGVTEIGEGGNLWLDLRDIKEMYLRAVASPQSPTPYSYILSQPPASTMSYAINNAGEGGNSGTFVPDPNEDISNKTCIVFTHGFNQSDVSFTNYGETMFKRLWQLGYKGRFATYRWPTYGSGWSPGGYTVSAIGIYNDCEYVAYNSAGPLRQFVQSLESSSYKVDMMSHSLGSAVVGEALREGMTVQYYSMCHAAASASLYSYGPSYYPLDNPSGPNYLSFDSDPDTGTRNLAYSSYQGSSTLGYNGYFGQINANVTGGSIVNFYDETDSAITTWWTVNNIGFKPQPLYGGYGGQYYYDFSQPAGDRVEYGYVLSGQFYDWRYVTHADEGKAYVDQSLTGSIGSSTAFKGALTAQGISEDAMTTDHSYEWNHTFQDSTTFSFYNSLLTSYHFTPISIPTSP